MCQFPNNILNYLIEIRTNQEQLDSWINKSMVESEDQVTIGLKHKAFDKDTYIRVDQLMHRLCGPHENNGKKRKMQSFIFWTKETPFDNMPTWDKMVSNLV